MAWWPQANAIRPAPSRSGAPELTTAEPSGSLLQRVPVGTILQRCESGLHREAHVCPQLRVSVWHRGQVPLGVEASWHIVGLV
jgi:hypothetical protein